MAIALPGHAANTWRDFLALGDHDRRELIDGLFLEIDVPTRIHEWIVATLLTHLRHSAMGKTRASVRR